MKKIIILANLMISMMGSCEMCGFNEMEQGRYSVNFQNIEQCRRSIEKSAVIDPREILPRSSSECSSTNEVSLAMAQDERKHIFSKGSLTKVCFDKVVAINNRLNDWRQKHPSIIKYAKDAVKVGIGVARRYFGLNRVQKLFQKVGGKFIKSTLGIVKNSDVGEILTNRLTQQGYSAQEVYEYVGAIQGLAGKLFSVSDILLTDGDPFTITKNLAKSVVTDFLVKQGYSKSSAGKCVDIVFTVGRTLVNNRAHLVNH